MLSEKVYRTNVRLILQFLLLCINLVASFPMTILFEVNDPRGYRVVCTQETWEKHVLEQRPFMDGWENFVKSAIENPDIGIYQSVSRPNREIYYGKLYSSPRYIRIVVEFNDDRTGKVITAFPSDSGKTGERLTWPQSND